MKLGDKIKLHIERKKTFSDDVDITDGIFTIIEVNYGMPHCFSDNLWSQGFNSVKYGVEEKGRPDIVLQGSVYVPAPTFLDDDKMDGLNYDNKKVSWEIL